MSESETPYVLTGADIINEHALALGQLCIYWATLDQAILELISEFSGSKVLATAMAAPDTSSRCEQLRKLAYTNGPDGPWRESLITVINKTQGELAETRNRYIHDDWDLSKSGMIRIDRRPKLNRPKARAPIQLTADTRSVVPVERVRFVGERVVETMLAFTWFGIDLRRWKKEGQPTEPPPQALLVSTSRPLRDLLQEIPITRPCSPPPSEG